MKIQKMINYRIRSIRMLFVILMTLAAGAQMAHAAKGGRSDFYQKYMSRPSEELIRIGKDYRLRKNKPDSALLFFTIVAGRYTPNMSAEEKREVVEALNMNYFIYSFTYLNYPKAYENLLRAHTISKELGETSAALYFNLGSMYQLVAGQGRQWKLYSKALDCYRKGVRLALAKKDMPTADMAFTNMTTLADVVGEFANTKKEWNLYRKAHTKRNTEHYKYNITLLRGHKTEDSGTASEGCRGLRPAHRHRARHGAQLPPPRIGICGGRGGATTLAPLRPRTGPRGGGGETLCQIQDWRRHAERLSDLRHLL